MKQLIMILLLGINVWIELETIPNDVESVRVYHGDEENSNDNVVDIPRAAIGGDNKVAFEIDSINESRFVQAAFVRDGEEGSRSDNYPTGWLAAPVILKAGVSE